MNKRRTTFLLITITLLALGLRLWRLGDVPPGLWWDEGHHDQKALDVLQGISRPIYFTGVGSCEPLHIYLTALLFRLFGVHYLGTRWVAALGGTLTIPALYWAAIEWLSDPLGHARASRIGLLAALNLTFILPHLLISRIGFEVVLVPAGATLMLAALGRAARLRRGARLRRAAWFALSGLILGITLYAAPAARVIPLLVVAWGVVHFLFDRTAFRQIWPLLALLTTVSILTYAPLGLYFLRHPKWFFGRISYVSAGARSGWLPLLASVWKTALGILVRGDTNPRHNLPGRPFLDPIQGLMFLVGLSILVWRARRQTHDAQSLLLIPLWMLVGLLPSALSDGAPTFTRCLGAAPPIALLVALGGNGLWRLGRRKYRRRLPTVCLALALTISAAMTMSDYFVRYPAHPEMFETYQTGLWDTLMEARQASQDGKAYLSPVPGDPLHPTVDFVLRTNPEIRPYDGRLCQVFPQKTNEEVTFALLVLDDRESLERLQVIFPDGLITRQILHEPERYPFSTIFRVPPGTKAQIKATPTHVRFGDIIELVAYDYQLNEDVLDLTLYWRSLTLTSIEYTVFTHLHVNEQTIAGQHDGWPCAGSYPTSRWQPGEIVMDRHLIHLSTKPRAPSYELYVGLYNLFSLQRLPITVAPPSVASADNRAHIATIERSP